MTKRVHRLNSLLREVLSDVIHKEVRNPNLHPLFTITKVEITRDLEQAKVYVSVIGTAAERKLSVDALNSAAGFIAMTSSRQVTMHTFPKLTFYPDDTVEKQARIAKVVQEIQEERKARGAE